MTEITPSSSLRRVVLTVALLNLGYFFVEFTSAISISSVSLFADSIDFLEDTSVNLLILFALGWSLRARSRMGMVLAVILLVPGLAALWTVWQKISSPLPPDPITLSVVGAGALAVNVACAFILARFRKAGGSSHQSRVPVRAQRRLRQHRDHRGRLAHRLHALDLARRARGSRHRRDECRCGEGSMGVGATRAARCLAIAAPRR